MKISVTAEDIERGEHNLGCCPVALALRRSSGEMWLVNGYRTWIKADPVLRCVLLPEPVQEWICLYDIKEDVEPMEFEINLPEKNLVGL